MFIVLVSLLALEGLCSLTPPASLGGGSYPRSGSSGNPRGDVNPVETQGGQSDAQTGGDSVNAQQEAPRGAPVIQRVLAFTPHPSKRQNPQ